MVKFQSEFQDLRIRGTRCCSSPKANRLKAQKELMFQFEFKSRDKIAPAQQSDRRYSILLPGIQPFCLCRPSTDWIRPTHTREGNLLYSVHQFRFCFFLNFNGKPFQYFCLGDPMNRGAKWPKIHGVTKSWTWLSNWAHSYLTLWC